MTDDGDQISGLNEVKFTLNGNPISPAPTGEADWTTKLTEKAEYSFNLKDYAIQNDSGENLINSGKNVLEIMAWDNAENAYMSKDAYTFYVDDKNPEISEILFEENVGDNDPKNNLNKGYSANIKNFATQDEETVNKQGEFAYFFNQTTTATVTVDDTVGEKPASSGAGAPGKSQNGKKARKACDRRHGRRGSQGLSSKEGRLMPRQTILFELWLSY